MKDFVDFLGKYTGKTWDDFVGEAMAESEESHQAHQDSLVEDLMGEIETGNLITWEHDSDGDRPNYDNLKEWLKMYYRLEKK